MSKTSGADGDCSLDMSPVPDYYKFGYDNSMSCYVTNYVLAICILICICVLYRGYTPGDLIVFQEHTRLFVILKFLFVGVSVTAAGFVHQGCFGTAGDLSDGQNGVLWLIVEGALLIAGGFTFCASHTLIVAKDNEARNHMWYLCSFAIGGLGTFGILHHFGTDAFAICGFLGEFLPDFWLVIHVALLRFPCGEFFLSMKPGFVHIHYSKAQDEVKDGWFWTLISVIVIYVGGAVQVLLGSSCGNTCPQSCIFPALYFNHNAFFHLAQVLGMILMTKGMAAMCKAVEIECRRSNDKEEALLL